MAYFIPLNYPEIAKAAVFFNLLILLFLFIVYVRKIIYFSHHEEKKKKFLFGLLFMVVVFVIQSFFALAFLIRDADMIFATFFSLETLAFTGLLFGELSDIKRYTKKAKRDNN